MVRGIEQLYQDTADAVSDILDRRLPGGFAQVWIKAEMLGEICHVTCFYSKQADQQTAYPLRNTAALMDIYLIFDRLARQMVKEGSKWSTATLLINNSGEYFFELGSGSQRSWQETGVPLEAAAQESATIETVHFSPGALTVEQ